MIKLVLLNLLTVLIAACGGTDITEPPMNELSTINIHISDTAGEAVRNAEIIIYEDQKVIKPSALVNKGTYWSIDVPAGADFTIQSHAPSFASHAIPVKAASAGRDLRVSVTLIPRANQVILSEDGMDTHYGNEGASVTVDKADFVDMNGDIVAGDISLSITPVDVSDSTAVAGFPGTFTGVQEYQNEPTPIVSLGVAEFEFNAGGQPVQLAPGAAAEITIPIYVTTYPNNARVQLGDNVPLWSLNETTGIWVQEGEGMVIASDASPTGLALQATVTHFTWWNCDVSVSPALVEVTVLADEVGSAIIHASAPDLVNWRGDSASTTVSIGGTTNPLYIPSNIEVCLFAEFSFENGETAWSERTCVIAKANETLQVTLAQLVGGPINVIAIPGNIAKDTVNEVGFITKPLLINILPLTKESTIQYEITSGVLPPGILLDVSGNRAKIRGVPELEGSYRFVLTAEDTDGFSDVITFNIEVRTSDPNSIDFHLVSTYYGAYIGLKVTSGSAIIDWNDGSPTESVRPTGRLTLVQHLYGRRDAPGKITVTTSEGLSSIEELWLGSSNLEKFKFSTEVFEGLTRLKKLRLDGDNSIYGDVSYLPNNLEDMYVHGSNKMTGDVIGLPRSLTSINFHGEETLSGNISSLPPRLKFLNLSPYWGYSTLTGDIANLPVDIETVGISGANTVFGSLNDIPSTVTRITIQGKNTVSGTIDSLPNNLTNLHIFGENTISGDLDKTSNKPLNTLRVGGQNQISGKLSALSRSIVYFGIEGNNTITGSIDTLPDNLVQFSLEGNNTVFGDIGQMPANSLSVFKLGGLNSVSEFGAEPTWAPVERLDFALTGGSSLDSNAVDRMFTFFSQTLPDAGNESIYLGGNNAPRTTASDDAVLLLESKGYSVRTN